MCLHAVRVIIGKAGEGRGEHKNQELGRHWLKRRQENLKKKFKNSLGCVKYAEGKAPVLLVKSQPGFIQ